jgi:hypothetical protein
MNRSLIALAALALSTAFAFAEDAPSTFDFTKPVTQLNGKPFVDAPDLTDAEKQVVTGLIARGYTVGKPEENTLATIAENVLTIDMRDETTDYLEKGKKFNLATQISRDPKHVILNAAQIAMLEKLIGKAYNPLIVGQVLQVIDPNALK